MEVGWLFAIVVDVDYEDHLVLLDLAGLSCGCC